MSAAETFQARLTDLAAELNDRHKYLAHEFAPYLEPQISSYIEFYGADERRLLTEQISFDVSEYGFADREKSLRELDSFAKNKANSFCVKVITAPVEFRNGSKLSAASDGVRLIDATGGLLVEHVSSALENFENFSERSAFIVTRTEQERLELIARFERNQDIGIRDDLATHVLGSKIITLPSNALPAARGERTCIVLTGGALIFQITWSAGADCLTATLSGVRVGGGLVHLIRTAAC